MTLSKQPKYGVQRSLTLPILLLVTVVILGVVFFVNTSYTEQQAQRIDMLNKRIMQLQLQLGQFNADLYADYGADNVPVLPEGKVLNLEEQFKSYIDTQVESKIGLVTSQLKEELSQTAESLGELMPAAGEQMRSNSVNKNKVEPLPIRAGE